MNFDVSLKCGAGFGRVELDLQIGCIKKPNKQTIEKVKNVSQKKAVVPKKGVEKVKKRNIKERSKNNPPPITGLTRTKNDPRNVCDFKSENILASRTRSERLQQLRMEYAQEPASQGAQFDFDEKDIVVAVIAQPDDEHSFSELDLDLNVPLPQNN